MGVAAATMLFTQVNAVLFKTLAVDRPWQLRHLSWTSPDLSFAGPFNERFWRIQLAAGRTITAFSYTAIDRSGKEPPTSPTSPAAIPPSVSWAVRACSAHRWSRGTTSIPWAGGQLRARLDVLLTQAIRAAAPPGWDAPARMHLTDAARGFDTLRAITTRPLLLLVGAVAVLLLIACVNVAGLLLSRAGAQEAEVATRYALGASRARILRLRLFESLLLSTIAGAAGAALAFAAGPLLRPAAPA